VDDPDVRRLVGAYDPGFLESMLVPARAVDDGVAVAGVLETLSDAARRLASALLLGVGAGRPVPPRFREAIDDDGDELWRSAVLIPSSEPTRGATIDPRFHAARCRTNPALAGCPLLPELSRDTSGAPHPPAADARWDAVVVAAALASEPLRLTSAGVPRRDDERRLLSTLGGDDERWHLALEVARSVGLARPVGDRLEGWPETRARVIPSRSRCLRRGASRSRGTAPAPAGAGVGRARPPRGAPA